MADFIVIFYWYLILLLFGIGTLPATHFIFNKLKDRGYSLAKPLGVLLLAYIFWLFGSLKLFNFQWIGVWIVLLMAVPWLVVYYKYRPTWQKLLDDTKKKWRIWMIEELLFIIGLFSWAWIRSFQPNIEGLEKYMDFGFVNSILRSEFMPPKDMWLAGFTINYYYFGHYISAFLTKISGLPAQYTYNLMLATVLGLSLSASFAFVFNFLHILIKKVSNKAAIFGGLLAAFLVNLAGNLHTIVFAFRRGVTYWYPDATRFIGYNPDVADKTIHEFPSYSYVVADLHGHMISIPFVILFLTALLYFINFILIQKNQTVKYLYTLLLGFLLSVLYMGNSWDLPIYYTVFLVCLTAYNLFYLKNSSQRWFNILFFGLTIPVLWFVFTLPYNLNFTNFSQGIGLTWTKSRFYQLIILWGFGWWFGLSFAIFQLTKWLKTRPKNRLRKFAFPVVFPIILTIASIGLIVLPEFFYLKDIYIKSYYRANTMFKLGYQAFIMSALTASIVLVYIWYQKTKLTSKLTIKIGWLIMSTALIAAVGIYPYFAIKGYYGTLKDRHSLDGWRYLAQNQPGDLAAILWFRQNVADQPVVLEAVGDSYTTYARISANTGLPTVLGWPVHEWLWRGSYDIPGARTAEVQKAYEGNSLEELKSFLIKYNVKYMVVGKLERDKYKNLNEDNIKNAGRLVYTDSGTAIYQVNF